MNVLFPFQTDQELLRVEAEMSYEKEERGEKISSTVRSGWFAKSLDIRSKITGQIVLVSPQIELEIINIAAEIADDQVLEGPFSKFRSEE